MLYRYHDRENYQRHNKIMSNVIKDSLNMKVSVDSCVFITVLRKPTADAQFIKR